MLLSDGKIRALVENGVLRDANEGGIGPVSYDLTTDAFYTDDKKVPSVTLAPGESAFVSAKESIKLPDNLAARVLLRNSRMRQGLTLDAPLYFPGHETVVFFRVTNISADAIALDAGKGIAQIVFETVDGVVENPYRGAFSGEFDYRGMGKYTDVYANDMRKLENKADEIKGIEKRMYGNVLALMAIFAAIFTLVNVNAGILSQDVEMGTVLVVNLTIVGSFSLLVGLISFIMRPGEKKRAAAPIAIAVVALLVAVVLAAIRLS